VGERGEQIDLICSPQLMSAERPAAEQNGGYRVKRQAQYVTVRGRTR